MRAADNEILDTARRFIIEGHARNTAGVAEVARPPEPDAPFTFPSSPDPALTLDELLAHLGEYPPCPPSGMDPRGYMSDTVAYVVDSFDVAVPGEGIIKIRATIILLNTEDGWRVAHAHLSEGVAHLT